MKNSNKIIIPSEELRRLYLIELKSTTEIASMFDCSGVTVSARLKENKIPIRTPSERKMGKLNPMYGVKGQTHPRYGKSHTKKTCEKIKKKVPRGKRHFRYKLPHERTEPINNQIRNCYKMKIWRNSVYKRDGYVCQFCNKKASGNLNADHIVPFAEIKSKNNIKTLNQALLCEELWNVENGRTLCVDCHMKTNTWGPKTKKALEETEAV